MGFRVWHSPKTNFTASAQNIDSQIKFENKRVQLFLRLTGANESNMAKPRLPISAAHAIAVNLCTEHVESQSDWIMKTIVIA